MALKESTVRESVVPLKTEAERLEIAKEVVIKALLPVVFENVDEDERKDVFDDWYGKLLSLIYAKQRNEDLRSIKENAALSKKSESAPKKEGNAQSQRADNGEGKATEKQIKKIFALGHTLGFGRKELEEESEKVTGISELSRLDKWQASSLIDSLDSMLNVQEIYG